MNLPTFIVINGYRVHTMGVFLTLAFFITLFVLWQEGKKDGFSEERVFDVFLLSLFSSLVLSRIFYAVSAKLGLYGSIYSVFRFWTPGFDKLGALIGFFIILGVLTKVLKWSFYRVTDIFAVALCLGISVVSLGFFALAKEVLYLFLASGTMLVYVFLLWLRKRATSGLVFSLFAMTCIFVGVVAFPGKLDLIFYLCLFTMSLVIFCLRIKDYMAKEKVKPRNILSSFKEKLLAKSKGLEKQQQKLIDDDPYLVSGRTEDNSEDMDEAILEDSKKELLDAKKSALFPMISQVRRALARMKLGKYGICEVCGGEIEKARLEIYPEATTCSSCQSKRRN